MAGFFFISDKSAKPSELTHLNLFKLENLIPPKGINLFSQIDEIKLNFVIPRNNSFIL